MMFDVNGILLLIRDVYCYARLQCKLHAAGGDHCVLSFVHHSACVESVN
jgi:hypothetical protein